MSAVLTGLRRGGRLCHGPSHRPPALRNMLGPDKHRGHQVLGQGQHSPQHSHQLLCQRHTLPGTPSLLQWRSPCSAGFREPAIPPVYRKLALLTILPILLNRVPVVRRDFRGTIPKTGASLPALNRKQLINRHYTENRH